MPRRILLVRHGQSTWNSVGRWQGWADPPLSELGEAQAAEAASRLAGEDLGAVAASDLIRARRTAEIISGALDLGPVSVEPDLRERNVGQWSGLTRVEIGARWPAELAAWVAGRIEATPGGEHEKTFTDRVLDAAVRLVDGDGAGGDLLVVSHGGVARALDRVLGVTSAPVVNLGGRWYEPDGHGGLCAGDPVVLSEPAHRTRSPSA